MAAVGVATPTRCTSTTRYLVPRAPLRQARAQCPPCRSNTGSDKGGATPNFKLGKDGPAPVGRLNGHDISGDFICGEQVSLRVVDGVAAIGIHRVLHRSGLAVSVVLVGDRLGVRINGDGQKISHRGGAVVLANRALRISLLRGTLI